MDGHGGPWSVYIGRFLSGKTMESWKLISQEKPFLGKENGGNVGMGVPLIINHHFPYDVEIL